MATIFETQSSQAPDFTLPDAQGEPFHLYGHLQAAGTVIVFYRGHWCPYCRRYLTKLQTRLHDIQSRGVQLLAISPEPQATLMSLANQLSLSFPLLSDVEGVVIDRFGTRNGFAAVRSLMPHPSVFVIDGSGAIRFRSIDRNYKKRTPIRTILAQLDILASG